MEIEKKSDFIYLNCHSEYSFFSGKAKISDLVYSASSLGMSTLGLTDIGNMYGAMEFYRACIKANIKPIIGTEAVLNTQGSLERLILLARNNTGYKNLTKLYDGTLPVNKFGSTPIELNALSENAKGIICIILSLDVNNKGNQNWLTNVHNIFDTGCIFLGLSYQNKYTDKKRLNGIIDIAKKNKVPLVALYPDIVIKSRHHTLNTEILESKVESAMLFSEWPDAISNTLIIGDMINLEIDLDGPRKPVLAKLGTSVISSEYLRRLVMDSITKYYDEITEIILKRVEAELSAIIEAGYEDYILLVWDLVNFAKENGVILSQGYGVAPSSLVNYVLGITNLDPLRFGLVFERFLNHVDRSAIPVFLQFGFQLDQEKDPQYLAHPRLGIQVSYEHHDALIKYIETCYGSGSVARTVAFGRQRQPSIQSYSEICRGSPCALRNSSPSIAIDSNGHMDGIPLTSLSKQEIPSTHYSDDDVETFGPVCVNLYSLWELSLIEKVVAKIRLIVKEFSITCIPLEDAHNIELFREGNTENIIAFKGVRMKQLLKAFSPSCFNDLVILYSMNRPIYNQYLPDVINAKNVKARASPIGSIMQNTPYRESLDTILAETYGELVYHEQLINILHCVYGFDLGQAVMIHRVFRRKFAPEMAMFFDES
ncbi:MAG: PHP domain-containing protein, partial [Sulfuricurvum sp.]|nr:PHP domain-containing protein [Sulfuricurvum sp.]